MTRAVLYARYSSDLQSPLSIADQHRSLREALDHHGLREVAAYEDAAVSGSSWARPGLESALSMIDSGRADVLFAEALDRISRDIEHTARIAKRVAFRGARIITLSEGEISALHIGLSGTMAQLYLEQLAEKTKRGLRGVVADGRIPTGRAYGYRPTEVRGKFEIVPEQAQVVQRIMRDYAAGISPRAIAKAMNTEGIPGPRASTWKAATIIGDRAAGTGIVNNRLYTGEIVWNRSTWRKDPVTGRRKPFALPEDQWIIAKVDHLRIVNQDLWELVKMRQGQFIARGAIRRPTRPLSGLLVCGCCGHRLTILGRDRYGCPVNKEQGLCDMGRTAAAADVERRVLDGLRVHLCHPEAVKSYAEAYVAERKRLRADATARGERLRKALAEAEREQQAALDMIGHVPATAMEALGKRIGAASDKIAELNVQIATNPDTVVLDINTFSASHLAHNLDRLWERLLSDEESAADARAALSALISRIVLHPGEFRGEYSLEIEGDAAAFMGLASEADLQKALVAGAGFEPAAFRL